MRIKRLLSFLVMRILALFSVPFVGCFSLEFNMAPLSGPRHQTGAIRNGPFTYAAATIVDSVSRTHATGDSGFLMIKI